MSKSTQTKKNPYKQIVEEWLEEAHSALRILKKLREMGFDRNYSSVKAYMSSWKMDLNKKGTVQYKIMLGKQGQIDWGSFDKRQIDELDTMRCVGNGENVVFLALPDVGKTHFKSVLTILDDKITVVELVAGWYANCKDKWSYARPADYVKAINTHICPVISAMKVRDVKPEYCQRVLVGIARLSHSLQGKVVTSLKQIFGCEAVDFLVAPRKALLKMPMMSPLEVIHRQAA